jgi:hypothetical protein
MPPWRCRGCRWIAFWNASTIGRPIVCPKCGLEATLRATTPVRTVFLTIWGILQLLIPAGLWLGIALLGIYLLQHGPSYLKEHDPRLHAVLGGAIGVIFVLGLVALALLVIYRLAERMGRARGFSRSAVVGWMGTALLVIAGLFPPWYFRYAGMKRHAGLGFILTPPQLGRSAASIDIAQLFVEWIVIAAATFLAAWIMRESGERSSDDRGRGHGERQ